MLKWVFPLNRWPLILIKPLIPFLFQRSDTLELYRRVFSSFKEQIAKSMAKLSRAKKQPVPPKDLSSLQGIADEMKNRLSRAVAIVSVFTIYDMLFLCHSLQTLAWVPARCFGIGLKPKPRKKKSSRADQIKNAGFSPARVWWYLSSWSSILLLTGEGSTPPQFKNLLKLRHGIVKVVYHFINTKSKEKQNKQNYGYFTSLNFCHCKE